MTSIKLFVEREDQSELIKKPRDNYLMSLTMSSDSTLLPPKCKYKV